MLVTLLLPRMLRDLAGGADRLDVEVADEATVGALLDVVGARYPLLERRLRDERGALRRYVNVYVGGEECRQLNGADTVLGEGAEVQVIPSVAGG
jgi:sulfur-carrier protein